MYSVWLLEGANKYITGAESEFFERIEPENGVELFGYKNFKISS